MNAPARVFCALQFVGFCLISAQSEEVSTTLNFVNEAGVNEVGISLTIPEFETGNDTTNLTGTVDVTLEIDPSSGVVTELSFTGGAASGTPITLAGDSTNVFNPGSYSFTSTVLTGTANTLSPPGPVSNSPGMGDYDAALHELIINGGVLSGSVNSLFVNETVNQNFGTSPGERHRFRNGKHRRHVSPRLVGREYCGLRPGCGPAGKLDHRRSGWRCYSNFRRKWNAEGRGAGERSLPAADPRVFSVSADRHERQQHQPGLRRF